VAICLAGRRIGRLSLTQEGWKPIRDQQAAALCQHHWSVDWVRFSNKCCWPDRAEPREPDGGPGWQSFRRTLGPRQDAEPGRKFASRGDQAKAAGRERDLPVSPGWEVCPHPAIASSSNSLIQTAGSSDGRSAPHATAVWAGSNCQELARPVSAVAAGLFVISARTARPAYPLCCSAARRG
jgi:hypothetical protein